MSTTCPERNSNRGKTPQDRISTIIGPTALRTGVAGFLICAVIAGLCSAQQSSGTRKTIPKGFTSVRRTAPAPTPRSTFQAPRSQPLPRVTAGASTSPSSALDLSKYRALGKPSLAPAAPTVDRGALASRAPVANPAARASAEPNSASAAPPLASRRDLAEYRAFVDTTPARTPAYTTPTRTPVYTAPAPTGAGRPQVPEEPAYRRPAVTVEDRVPAQRDPGNDRSFDDQIRERLLAETNPPLPARWESAEGRASLDPVAGPGADPNAYEPLPATASSPKVLDEPAATPAAAGTDKPAASQRDQDRYRALIGAMSRRAPGSTYEPWPSTLDVDTRGAADDTAAFRDAPERSSPPARRVSPPATASVDEPLPARRDVARYRAPRPVDTGGDEPLSVEQDLARYRALVRAASGRTTPEPEELWSSMLNSERYTMRDGEGAGGGGALDEPWSLGADLDKYRAHALREGSRDPGECLGKAAQQAGLALEDGVNVFTLGYASERGTPFRDNDGKGPLNQPDGVPKQAGRTIASVGDGLYSIADLITFDSLSDLPKDVYQDNNPLVRPFVFTGRTIGGAWKTTEEIGNAITWGYFDNFTGCVGMCIEDIFELLKHGGQAITNLARGPVYLVAGRNEKTDEMLDWVLLVPPEFVSNVVEMKGISNMEDYEAAFADKGVIGSVLELAGSTWLTYEAIDEICDELDDDNGSRRTGKKSSGDTPTDPGGGGEGPPPPPPEGPGFTVVFGGDGSIWTSD